ncbi:ATP-grasp domain-containing protein [Streptomyces piniterrae]|uniref:ATP-grasp domain-containing protein n=1 Tax=Streptomyces piniterrae TaxID=2571125 RepID=A0A4U0NXU8_9ACTN|nr:ATP-grasp domain-containing protein [Streptomyces piniterrae]TJZ59012.1 ATP-grasp domain-containing protein [Streptomyces piniterrae]
MGTVIVLGYRKGLAEAIERRGLNAFHVVAKHKKALAGTRYMKIGDLENAQEILRAVLIADIPDVVGVVTGHDRGVFTAALLREHLGLPGNRDYAGALRFRDKYLQKSALPAGVERARCRPIDSATSYGELAAALGTPFIVKPANGAGAVGTVAVGSEQEFTRHLEPHLGGSDIACVAESFVHGREIHIDGVWYGGRVLWNSVAQYNEPPMKWNDGVVLATQVLSRAENAGVLDGATELAEQALKGLDAPDCVFHLEAYVRGGNLVFGECALRVSGTHMPEIVELTHGVNLYDASVSLALGEDPSATLVPKTPEEYYACVYLRRFDGIELTRADFAEHFPFHELDYPDHGRGPAGMYGRVGHAFVSAPDNAQLSELIARMASFNETGRV